ncbi:hypothetical protein B0H11DRAFT_2257628 [Mycena galericulata]|nr:hypothetical protein B0H11DRAFT_2257628 [Mycena galericulata]
MSDSRRNANSCSNLVQTGPVQQNPGDPDAHPRQRQHTQVPSSHHLTTTPNARLADDAITPYAAAKIVHEAMGDSSRLLLQGSIGRAHLAPTTVPVLRKGDQELLRGCCPREAEIQFIRMCLNIPIPFNFAFSVLTPPRPSPRLPSPSKPGSSGRALPHQVIISWPFFGTHRGDLPASDLPRTSTPCYFASSTRTDQAVTLAMWYSRTKRAMFEAGAYIFDRPLRISYTAPHPDGGRTTVSPCAVPARSFAEEPLYVYASATRRFTEVLSSTTGETSIQGTHFLRNQMAGKITGSGFSRVDVRRACNAGASTPVRLAHPRVCDRQDRNMMRGEKRGSRPVGAEISDGDGPRTYNSGGRVDIDGGRVGGGGVSCGGYGYGSGSGDGARRAGTSVAGRRGEYGSGRGGGGYGLGGARGGGDGADMAPTTSRLLPLASPSPFVLALCLTNVNIIQSVGETIRNLYAQYKCRVLRDFLVLAPSRRPFPQPRNNAHLHYGSLQNHRDPLPPQHFKPHPDHRGSVKHRAQVASMSAVVGGIVGVALLFFICMFVSPGGVSFNPRQLTMIERKLNGHNVAPSISNMTGAYSNHGLRSADEQQQQQQQQYNDQCAQQQYPLRSSYARSTRTGSRTRRSRIRTRSSGSSTKRRTSTTGRTAVTTIHHKHSEYGPSELYEVAGLAHRDGTTYSAAAIRALMRRHFHWMAEHGAFLQRFVGQVDPGNRDERFGGTRRLRDSLPSRYTFACLALLT